MVGSTVSQVEISHHPDFAMGDLVLSQGGWQDYAISDGRGYFASTHRCSILRMLWAYSGCRVYSLYGLTGDW